jgi:MFS transporter, YNFM family, putative membrane transport protein
MANVTTRGLHMKAAAYSHALATNGDRSNRLQSIVISTIGFLTLTDLFAAQAILPSLARHYGVMPSQIGLAVNSSTLGMALSCLGVALVSRHLNRRNGIWISLALLSVPTALLAFAPDLPVFALLRIMQGVCMAAAFTLTMAYLAENCSADETSNALAAYITGVVASNLVGRLISATVADIFGLGVNFYLLAFLNLAGALLVFATLKRMPRTADPAALQSPLASWGTHLGNPALRAAFFLGFLVLFAFIGTFTYVNFVLAAPPIGLGSMTLGLVYFVFLPSMFTTPLAGRVADWFGLRTALWAGLAIAAAGLPLLLSPSLPAVLAGMVLVGVGTFFAQAIGTGFVGRAANGDRAAASGLYLASYYLGGLAGAAVLGQVFDNLGWPATVLGVGVALALAALLGFKMTLKR